MLIILSPFPIDSRLEKQAVLHLPNVPQIKTGRRGILSVRHTAVPAAMAETIELTKFNSNCVELDLYPRVS